MIVVADASPLRYLILIEHVHVLPALYGRVVMPPASWLSQERTPDLVKTWLTNPPEWLLVQGPTQPVSHGGPLGAGEREAIGLAAELPADALLIDDREGRLEAKRLRLHVLGTLRVLADAAEHGLADLPSALDRLQRTNFRASEPLTERLLEQDAKRRGQ